MAGTAEEKEREEGQHAGQRHGAGRGQDLLGPGAAPAPQDAGEGTGRAVEAASVRG